jgi:PPIC-type PPIASE domain
MTRLRKALREPLLHFLVLGAGLFLLFGVVGDGSGDRPPDEIVVTAGRIESLAEVFGRTWQRPPTEAELDGLVEGYIREEVLYREAVAMGLDRDDTVIRRRLSQKMEFVSEDIAAQAEPTDEELRAYLAENPDAFRVEPRFTFGHVYLNPDRRGDALRRDVARLLAELNATGAGADIETLGDGFLLGHDFTAASRSEVAGTFGEGFAAELARLEPGVWRGPVASGYGMHLVLVRERSEGRVPPLAEVREAVRREWANARRIATNERLYRSLRQRYTVTVQAPGEPGGAGAMAAEVRE